MEKDLQFTQNPAYTQGAEILFEAVEDKSFLKRKSITFFLKSAPPGKSGVPAGFFVNCESRKNLVVHAGRDASGPVVGRIEMPTWRSPSRAEFSMQPLPNQQGGAPAALTQRFIKEGVFKRTLSCHLPALRAALGAGQAAGDAPFTWKSTSQHGAKRHRGFNVKLVDANAPEGSSGYAAFIKGGTFSGALGELHVLRADLTPDAMAQVLVSCVTLLEILRSEQQNSSAAAGASAGAGAAAAGGC